METKIKIKEITVSQTRQVHQYEPVNYTLKAEIPDGVDPEVAASYLHELTLRILFRDKPVERDLLIKQLITDAKPVQEIDPEVNF